MIEGVRVEDWSFIFEPENPNCEVKFNDLLDKYFENANNEVFKENGLGDGLIEIAKIKYLKDNVRRKDLYDATWIVNIIPSGGEPSQIYFGSKGDNRTKINLQYKLFNEMLDKVRNNKGFEGSL